MNARLLGLLLLLSVLLPSVDAHPLAPALLELRQLPSVEGSRYAVLWRLSATRPLGSDVQPQLPVGCHADTPVQQAVDDNQTVTQRWQILCGSGGLVGQSLGVTGLDKSPINVILRLEASDGVVTTSLLDAEQAVYTVPRLGLVPPVFRTYLGLGVEHLLSGLDHVLFLVGLLLLVPKLRPLVLTITAFTLGHSVTLALATLGLVKLNASLTELAIALSILVLAHEVVKPRPQSLMRRWPWLMAAAFGLLHGLGFAGALAEVGLPSGEIPLALFAFNVGIELGQLLVVAAVMMVFRLWMLSAGRRLPAATAMSQAVIAPYVIGALAAYWCIERAVVLLA